MSVMDRSNAALVTQQQLIGTARSILHLCRSNERAAAEEIEAYARELSNNEVDRILEVVEKAALGQLEVPFALEDGVRVVLAMPRLWARCISLLLRMMQAERISGHTAMLLMSEVRMCLVVQYRKLQLSAAALSSDNSAIEELQAVCKRCIQPFMQQSSKITAGEVLCLEALPSLLRVLAACPLCEGVVDQIVEIFLQGSWPAGSVLPIMTVFADIAALVRMDAWRTLMYKIQGCTAHSRDNSDFAGLIRLCLRLATSRARPDASEDSHTARGMTTDWLNCARGLYARVPENEVQTVEIVLEQYLLQVPLVVEKLVALIEASCLQQDHDDAEQSDVSEEASPLRPLSWHDIRLLMLLGRSFRVSASERALAATSSTHSSREGGSRGEIDLATFRRKIQDHICRVLFTCMMAWSSSAASDLGCGGGLTGLLVRTLGTAVDAEPQASQSSSGPTWTANFATAASCARAELLLQTCIRVMQFDKAVISAASQASTTTAAASQGSRPASSVTGVRDKAPLEGGSDYAAAFMPATDYVVWASKDAVLPSSPSLAKPVSEVTATSAQQFARETLRHVYELVQASRAAVVSGLFQAAHQVLTGPDQRVAWDRKGVVQSFQLALLDIVSREDHDEPVLKEFQKLLPTLFTLPDPFCSGLLVPVCNVCCNSSGGVHQVRQLCRKQLQRPNHSMKARAIDAMAAILPRLERSAQLDLIQALGFVFTFPVQYRKRLYGGVAAHFLHCCFSARRHSMHGDALQLLATKLKTQLQQYFQSPDEQGEEEDGLLELSVAACFDSTGGKDAEFVLKDDFAGLLVAKWLSDILADRQAARGTFDGLLNYLTKEASAQGSSKRQAMPAWTGEKSGYFAATLKFLETGLGDKDETDRLVPQKLEWQLAYELLSGLVTALSIGCRLFAPEQDDGSQQRCLEALSCVQGLTDILLEVLQQRAFGRAYDGATQPYNAQSKPSNSPLASSASWAELQTWTLGKQAEWFQQLHCHDGTEQYPRSVLAGTLAFTVWGLGQGLMHGGQEPTCSLQQRLRLLANAYEAFVSYKVEQEVLNMVPRWACAQSQRQQKRPSRRAAQKVQLRAQSAYLEAQQITLSDSDGEDREERITASLAVQTPSEPLPPIHWSVGSATAFFRHVLTSLPKRVITALDRHGVECIRAGNNESSPRLVVNSVTNRLRMDILHLRTHVLEVLAGIANRWCDAAAMESWERDVGAIAPAVSSTFTGQLVDTDAVPLYEHLAVEFEKSIADGLPPRLCIAYCDAILGFVRCLRERGLLAMRQETDGAVAVVRHRKTNAVFDLTTASDMRTCGILFNIMSKYSLPYGTVLRKLLDLVLLLSGNTLSVSKDICECCLNYTVEQARSDQEKVASGSSSSSSAAPTPMVALTSKTQCEQVLQHMLRVAEAELMSSRPRLLPLEDLTSFMAMFWGSFRTLAAPEPAADASASKKQLALDLFTAKTQARLLKMFTELLRKCVKEMNLLIQLHAAFKKLPSPEEPAEPDEVEPPVAISEHEHEATVSKEPIGLRILRAVLSQASIPICNIRRWAKRRNAAQSDEVSHQIGNLLYRTEEVELVGARLLRRLGNSDPMRKHARPGAQEAVREVQELVQALLKEITQRTVRKRKVGDTAFKAPPRRSGRRASSSRHAAADNTHDDDEDDEDDDDDNARVRTSATQRQQAARRRIVADEDEDEDDEGDEEIQELDEKEVAAALSSSDEGSGSEEDDPAKTREQRPAPKPARRRAKRVRLRSRHDVIDRWLAEEQGDDTYADLEDFIVA